MKKHGMTILIILLFAIAGVFAFLYFKDSVPYVNSKRISTQIEAAAGADAFAHLEGNENEEDTINITHDTIHDCPFHSWSQC